MPFPDTEQGRDVSLLTSLYRVFLYGFTHTNGIKLCTISDNKANCEFKARGYMPNGITRKDNKLFVGDSVAKTVVVYKIITNFDLEIVETLKINHSVDNLHYQNGEIYATGVNSFYDFLKYSNTVKKGLKWHFVPGGVTKVYWNGNKWAIKEVVMQDKLSLPSTAININDTLIVCSVIDSALLFCPLK